MDIKFFTKEENFVKAGIDLIAKIIGTEPHDISIALSGGTTPAPLYNKMAQSPVFQIQKINFWQVDERYLPKTDKNSNQKMINDTLLSGKNAAHSVHFFDTSLEIEKCGKQYEEELEKNLKDGFDLVILGIGIDGHTASLFPGSPELDEEKSLVTHTNTKKNIISNRLTLTFPAILKSKKILILLKGNEKQFILHELTGGKLSEKEFPAKKLLKHPNLTIFYLH